MSESLTGIAATIYNLFLPIALIVLAVDVVLFVPMCFVRRLRRAAGTGFFFSSFVFGLTTWMLGAVVTFASMGWVGLVIGLMIAGLGVVPLGIIAAFFVLHEISLGVSLLVMVVLVFAARMLGAMLMESSPVPSVGQA